MKKNKIALYDPYLDIMGGGERHILSILKVLEDQGYDIDIFWPEDLNLKIKENLNLHFSKPLNFIKTWNNLGSMSRFQTLGDYELFFYVTEGSYFFSSAKRNIIFCMAPQKSLYQLSPLNRLKTWNAEYIANSEYTNKWLSQWGIDANVIYPYIDDEFLKADITTMSKNPVILTVGRFFKHLHAKRQDVAIDWFKELKKTNPAFNSYKLVLAGNVKEEDKEYLHDLMDQAEGHQDIIFKPNISFEEMQQLYATSQIYWHFAGFGVDTIKNPESVEHLGITPLEAMAMGCITCAYNIGGPKETIKHAETGYLFNNQKELFSFMNSIATNTIDLKQMTINAKNSVLENFSYDTFKKRVLEIL